MRIVRQIALMVGLAAVGGIAFVPQANARPICPAGPAGEPPPPCPPQPPAPPPPPPPPPPSPPPVPCGPPVLISSILHGDASPQYRPCPAAPASSY